MSRAYGGSSRAEVAFRTFDALPIRLGSRVDSTRVRTISTSRTQDTVSLVVLQSDRVSREIYYLPSKARIYSLE